MVFVVTLWLQIIKCSPWGDFAQQAPQMKLTYWEKETEEADREEEQTERGDEETDEAKKRQKEM